MQNRTHPVFGEPVPAPLLAPLDRVYDIHGNYLGLLDLHTGAIVDHERVTLVFMYRENMTFDASTWFYVDNQDHKA